MTRDERLTEKETIIRWDGHKDEVHIFTASPTIARKIEKAGHGVKRESKVKGRWSGSFYVLPYKALRWGVKGGTGKKRGPSPHGFQPKSA